MVEGQNKRKKLKFVCILLEVAGWGCLLSWSGLLFLSTWGSRIFSLNENTEEDPNILFMNISQIDFYRKTGKFANSLEQLGGIRYQTENYDFLIKVGDSAVKNIAISRNKKYKTFVGIVWVEKSGINTLERVIPEWKVCQGCGLTAPELEAIKNSEIIPGECPGVLKGLK